MSRQPQQQPHPNWKAPFFTVWTGEAISLLGSRVVQFALVWWLTRQTGSATVLATASLVALIPEIALGPIAGAYVDRWNRRLVMILADGLIALASIWLAYQFWIDAVQIWHIYLIMLIRSIAGSFQWPAMQASTSLMVPQQQLTRIAGMNQTLHGALNIVGPPLGALLMETLPLYGVMLVDVGTALPAIGALLIISIPQPARAIPTHDSPQKPSIWVDLKEGLAYIRSWPGLMALIGLAMVVKIALTPAFSLLPLLVSKHFHGDAAQLGLLEAVVGIGIVLGGLCLSIWGGFRRKIYTTLFGVTSLGLAFIVLGLTPAAFFNMALASIFVVGFTVSLADGPLMAIMQGTVAPEIQGRVFMLTASLFGLTSPFSLVVAGPISDWLGLQVWYVMAGLMCAGFGLAAFFIPAIVRIEENTGTARPAAMPVGR